ncbi:carbonyl reductase [NADPH] 3-like [Planococcus citri]|uniref:carbonyl reductase [NADPH] 3-like n=1 Tax=Planococcus citri TaxID=170843 RepID=UPI0031F83D28
MVQIWIWIFLTNIFIINVVVCFEPTFMQSTTCKQTNVNQMRKKVAIVTGGNKGIGYAIVKGLCKDFPGDVYLTARNEELGLASIKMLNDLGFNPKFHQLDVTDERSIITLRDHILEQYGGLDVLVNNAGVGRENDLEDPSFAIETIQVNYFGVRKTCDVLFPILRSHARVVNLSSKLGFLFNIPSESLREKLASKSLTGDELDELMRKFIKSIDQNDTELSSKWGKSAYAVSKAGVSALTRIQQREFLNNDERVDIVVNSVHPGYVDTDMTRHKGSLTTEEGAVAPLYAASLPKNVTQPKGAFIWKNKDVVDWSDPVKERLYFSSDLHSKKNQK